MPANPAAISYIRFSSAAQADGASLDRQTEAARRYCDDNGLKLSDELHDLGVSAFRGGNREGALGRLLQLLRDGRIAKGTRLLVESVDRLSRQEPADALPLVIDLIGQGMVIVTLNDGVVYDRAALNGGQAYYLLACIQRAHEESSTKSKRIRDAWRRKRDKMVGGKPMTKRCPAWLQVSEDGEAFEIKPEATASVRRIFQLCLDGMGTRSITKTLNAEGVPPIGRADSWHTSYVRKILTNRAVLGEFQPHLGTAGNRRPTGEVVEDYYPAVIDRSTFHRANKAMSSRQQRPPGRTGQWVGLLSGLLIDTLGSPWVQINKHKRQFISDKGRRSVRGHEYASVPAETFETLVLLLMRATWEPERATAAGPDVVEEAEANLADVKARLAAVQDGIANGDPATVTTLVAMVSDLEARRAAAEAEVERLKAEADGTGAELLPSMAERYFADPTDRAIRLKLRQVIREHVARVVIGEREQISSEPMKDPDTGRWIKRHAGQWVQVTIERVDGSTRSGRLFLPLRFGKPAVTFPLGSGEHDVGGWAAMAATRRVSYRVDESGATFTLHDEPLPMPPLTPIVTVLDVKGALHVHIDAPLGAESEIDEALASDGLRRGRGRARIGDGMYALKVLGRKGEKIEAERIREALAGASVTVQ